MGGRKGAALVGAEDGNVVNERCRRQGRLRSCSGGGGGRATGHESERGEKPSSIVLKAWSGGGARGELAKCRRHRKPLCGWGNPSDDGAVPPSLQTLKATERHL